MAKIMMYYLKRIHSMKIIQIATKRKDDYYEKEFKKNTCSFNGWNNDNDNRITGDGGRYCMYSEFRNKC